MDARTKTSETVANHQRKIGFMRLVRYLGISMSVISGHHIGTYVRDKGQAPAVTVNRPLYKYIKGEGYTEKKEGFLTYFCLNLLPGVDKLAVWLGVAWHEMGHVLWSPYQKSGLHFNVALNLLEDARIEGLLLGTYPGTRGSLQAALAYLMESMTPRNQNVQNLRYQYAWVVGRMHVDKSIRQQFRDTLIKHDSEHVANQIEDIFAQYLSMGTKYSVAAANALSDRLMALLNGDPSYKQDGQTLSDKGTGCVHEKQEYGASAKEPADGEMPESYEQDIKHGRKGTQAGMTPPTPEASKVSKDEQARRRVSAGNSLAKARKKLSQYLEEATASDTGLQQEVDTLVKIATGAGGVTAIRAGNVQSPNAEQMAVAREIRRIATAFNDTSGKGLVRRRDHGRIRPMRYERTQDLDSAYDMWEPGLEQEMFVGILMDTSGSMSGSPINDIVFGLEQGLADVATVETVYFNQEFTIARGPSTPTRMNVVKPEGGTDPSEGMAYLYHRIRQSSASNRMLIVYTDGSFNDDEDYDIMAAYVDSLMGEGVTVFLTANIGGQASLNKITSRSHRYRSKDVHVLNDLRGLPPIVTEWTKKVLAKPIGGYHA